MSNLTKLYTTIARSSAAHACRSIKDQELDMENAWASSRQIFTWYQHNISPRRTRYQQQLSTALILSSRHPNPLTALHEWKISCAEWLINDADLSVVAQLAPLVQPANFQNTINKIEQVTCSGMQQVLHDALISTIASGFAIPSLQLTTSSV